MEAGIVSTDECFVQNCYREHLGRWAETGGLNHWIAHVRNAGRLAVETGIRNSAEATLAKVGMAVAHLEAIFSGEDQESNWLAISKLCVTHQEPILTHLLQRFREESDRGRKLLIGFMIYDKNLNSEVESYLIGEGFDRAELRAADEGSPSDGTVIGSALLPNRSGSSRQVLRPTADLDYAGFIYRFDHKILR